MRLNRVKYQVKDLHLSHSHLMEPYRMGTEWLENGPEEKDLRVLFDSCLNMSQSVLRWPRRPLALRPVSAIVFPAGPGQ